MRGGQAEVFKNCLSRKKKFAHIGPFLSTAQYYYAMYIFLMQVFII